MQHQLTHVTLAALACCLLTGCPDGAAEEAGENLDDAVEDVRDEARDAVDEAADQLEELGDELEEASERDGAQ